MSLSEKAFLEMLGRDRPTAIGTLFATWVEGWTDEGDEEVVRQLALWATRSNGRLPRIELGDDTTIVALARECGLVYDIDDAVFAVRRVDHDTGVERRVGQALTLAQARTRAYRAALTLRNQYDAATRETITVCECQPGAPEDEHAGYQLYREGVLVAEFLIEPASEPGNGSNGAAA